MKLFVVLDFDFYFYIKGVVKVYRESRVVNFYLFSYYEEKIIIVEKIFILKFYE